MATQLIFTEFYNNKALDIINSLAFLPDDLSGDLIDAKTIQNIKHIAKKCKKNPKLKVIYTKSACNRCFAKYGLQNMAKCFRRLICDGNFVELDLYACHPSILLHLCQDAGLSCYYLDLYVNERDDCLDMIMKKYNIDKPEAKDIFKKITYGYGFNSLKQEYNVDEIPHVLKGFRDDIQRLMIHKKDELTIYEKAIAKTRAKKESTIYTGLAYLLYEYESRIMNSAIEYLKTKQITPCTYIHDGVIINKYEFQQYDENTFLNDLETHIENTQHIRMKFDIKEIIPTDNDFDTLKKLQEIASDQCLREDADLTDREAAAMVLEHYPGILVATNNAYFSYLHETGIYEEITREEDWFRVINAVGLLPIEYKEQTINARRIIPQLKSIIPIDKMFMKKQINTIGYLPFNNGIWDFDNKKLIDFTPELIFFYKMGYDLDFDAVDEDKVQEVYEKVYLAPVGNERIAKWNLQTLARAAAGKIEDKRLHFNVGDSGNNGKGTQQAALDAAFKPFVGKFNGKCLIYRKQGEASKDFSWLIDNASKRFCCSQEMSMKETADGNIAKMMSGGESDEMVARALYKSEVEFVILCTFFLYLNDIPEFEPMEKPLANRFRATEFCKEFVDKDDARAGKGNYLIGDPHIKRRLNQPEYSLAIAVLILRHYESEKPQDIPEILSFSRLYTDNASFSDWFFNNYEITDNYGDIINTKDIHSHIKQRFGKLIGPVKVKKELEKLGLTAHTVREGRTTKQVFHNIIDKNACEMFNV